MFKIALFASTILCTIMGFAMGSEFGLMGLVGINACFIAFMQYDKREVTKVHAKIEHKTRQVAVDTNPLVHNVLSAAVEIMKDYDHLPLWREVGKTIIIGFGTKHRVFIPLFEVKKNNVVSLTSQLDDVPEEAIMPLSSQRVPSLPSYQERKQAYDTQDSNRNQHNRFQNLR